ncbi:MAG: hypothetical protein ACLS36_05330 [Streptococcus sp.]
MTHYQELPQALMKEKHQGQTLTKEEVKVQTAHDLGVENVSKEEAKSMYKTMWIFEILKKCTTFLSIGQIQDLFTFTQVRKLLRLGYVLT